MKLKIKNTRLSGNALFVVLLIIDLVAITALDFFVPALPNIRDELQTSEAYLNMTLFVFMAFGAIAVLVAAPVSDKIGRRPTMIASMLSFCGGSAICIVAPNVEVLIFGRIFQAFGMGGVEALATTIVKEAYAEKSLKLAMTLVQSLVLIGPFLAPFLGTFVLMIADWRMIFGVCLVAGVISLVLCFLIPETRPEGLTKTENRGSLKRLLSNRKFVVVMLVLGIAALPCYAFIGTFSYICLDEFSGDYLQYNILYAGATGFSIAAPFIYEWMSSRTSNAKIYILSMALMAISAVLLPFIGHINVWLFVLAYLPAEITEGIVRPMSYIILLYQPEQDVATASSLSNFGYTIITAFGSVLATLPCFVSHVQAIWVICLGTFVVCAALLLLIRKTKKD